MNSLWVDAAALAAIRADALLEAGDLEAPQSGAASASEIEKLQAEKLAPRETVQ
jgi:hypothetical protein